MNLFGFSLGSGLFLGDKKWKKAMKWDKIYEFVPNVDGWRKLFDSLNRTVTSSKLDGPVGLCFHFLARVPRILRNVGFMDDFKTVMGEIKSEKNFELGIHSRHGDSEVICSPRFLEAFTEDLEFAVDLGVSALVEHPPIGTDDTKEDAVKILTSPKVIALMDAHPGFPLCWENKADYLHKRRFFGSLEQMVLFREMLVDRLKKINRPDLIDRHKFCFDTGHLLIWRYTHEDQAAADEEIETYLPEFAKHLKVYHYQCNDGIKDAHMTPFSTKFMDHGSRSNLNQEQFVENFQILRNWITISERNKNEENMHQHLEAHRLPFTLDQYTEFADELASLIR